MKDAFVRITEFPKREVYPLYYQIGTQLPQTVLDTLFSPLFSLIFPIAPSDALTYQFHQRKQVRNHEQRDREIWRQDHRKLEDNRRVRVSVVNP